MEKVPIRLNELSPIIISLIEKVQMLDSAFLTKPQKLDITKEMLEIVDKFRGFFANASKSAADSEESKVFNEKLERAFSQFDWNANVAVSPLEFKKFSENGKSLISAVLRVLGTKGCGVLIIETFLKLCVKIVTEMTEKVNIDSKLDRQSFKNFLEAFSSTANMLKKYWHIVFSPDQKNIIMLCLNQVCKILPLLLKMIEIQNISVKNYALSILQKSFTKMLNSIHCNEANQPFDCGQEFVKLMNFCLYKLNEISNYHIDVSSLTDKARENSQALKPAIDELLCYVMSIAQVTTSETDYSAIISGSQKVLKEFNCLTTEIDNKNGYGIKLNASSTGEALCSLEHQVNTAVLKLVLEVFSGVNCPLKNIVNKCRIDMVKDNKASEDLNVLISDFDLEMDKIMQIGFFAISCTPNLNKILKIQSCLATLESLETELVPSLTALYVDCNKQNKVNFQHLIDFWLNEITELKLLIDSILDPASFCGVVLNQVKTLVETFKNDAADNSLNKAKSSLKQIIQFSRKLIKTLTKSMEDEVQNEETKDLLKNFQLAVQECSAMLELLGEEDDNETIDRAIKRCDLLLSRLNKLSLHLFDLVASESEDITEGKIYEEMTPLKVQIPQENYYKLCSAPDDTLSSPVNLELLTPYMNKEVLRSKKRNIFHTTPTKVDHSQLYQNDSMENFDYTKLKVMNWDKTPVSHKRSRCCKLLNLNLELGNTIDLEITNILENVSSLSATFNKITSPQKFKAEDENIEKKGVDVACGLEKDTECFKPTLTSSGCCAKLDSEEKDFDKVDNEGEDVCCGSKFSDRFLQSLNTLSQNSSLSLAQDNEVNSEVDTPVRLSDLKVVEQRINFLKQQLPGVLP